MANTLATIQDVNEAYPALCGKVLQHHLNMAATFVNLEAWGVKASFGHIEATAHFAARTPGSGAAGGSGPATAKSMGSVSASYAVATDADAKWGTTAYGLNFLALRESLLVLPVVGRKSLFVIA